MSQHRSSIAVIGNCQAPGVAACLRVLRGDIDATASDGRGPSAEAVAELIAGCDLAWVHPYLIDELRATCAGGKARIQTLPRIGFAGFHPDFVYASVGDDLLESPAGHYHSSIALLGWQAGLSLGRTMDLFGDAGYRRLAFYEYFGAARDALLQEGLATGLPLGALFEGWLRRGCFMHTINHARLFALADLARAALARSGLEATTPEGPDCLADRLALGPVLPVYPEIARRLGMRGGMNFKLNQRGSAEPARFIDLEEFVARSFSIYARHAPESITCERVQTPPYRELLTALRVGARPASPGNPYADLPAHRFWKRVVQEVTPAEVDPAVGTGFRFDEQTRIGTAGSCFAQHIARRLAAHGYRHYVTEAAPAGVAAAEAARRNYGIYSARYGNLYSARQLVQLLAMALGSFDPHDKAWLRDDGRFVDPFRPLVEPDGFASVEAVQAERVAHLARVKELFETLDVFVFTLGLTECWRSTVDGAVFPLAPGVAAQPPEDAKHEFVNFPVAEVAADLESFLADLAEINAEARVILTVSPVPLVATYEDRHVLTASAYSKAVLRAAADEVVQRHTQIHYFPSYEIITGAFNRGGYFDADLRSVTEQGIDHVMRVFLRHYGRGGAQGQQAPRPSGIGAEARAALDVVCDEEWLDRC